jgi:glycosyltransferase involved in cell wall biosynthesis
MRVAYDVTACIVGDTGIARHNEQLRRALVARGVDVRMFALGRASYPVPAGTRWTRVPLRLLHRGWRTIGLPRLEWITPSADVIHTNLVLPKSRTPRVVTVHDLDAIDHPDLHPARAVRDQEAMLASLSHAAVVLADSVTAATALQRRGVPDERIMVAPIGLTRLPDVGAPAEATDRYVLYVGTLHRRKGLDVLLRSWASAAIPDDVTLVLAGPEGNASAELRELAAQLGIEKRLRWAGRVDDHELAVLYRDAAVACFPSRSEGFGLPLLEAMAAGVPVVATDIPAFREVGGDACLFVPTGDSAALTEALVTALAGGSATAVRIERGFGRLSLFTWDACAARTVEAYERAVG